MATPELSSDCSRCFGLCCVLLPFSAAAGFGVDKPGGTPCLNLADDDRCRIHATLREDGWPGCTVFECFGAGQQVSQVTYGGRSWREQDNLAEMGAVLSVMRQAHEMLAHLTEVERRSPDPAATAVRAEIEALTGTDPESLLTLDLDGLLERVGGLLADASTRVRRVHPTAADRTRTDLAGRRLAGDHRGWTFRGATSSGPTSATPTWRTPTCSVPTSATPTSAAATCPRRSSSPSRRSTRPSVTPRRSCPPASGAPATGRRRHGHPT